MSIDLISKKISKRKSVPLITVNSNKFTMEEHPFKEIGQVFSHGIAFTGRNRIPL
jgi:hypothetical protein